MWTVEHCSLAASDLGVRGLFCWRNGPKSDRSLILSLPLSHSLKEAAVLSLKRDFKRAEEMHQRGLLRSACANPTTGALLSRSYMQCPYAFLARDDDATSLCT